MNSYQFAGVLVKEGHICALLIELVSCWNKDLTFALSHAPNNELVTISDTSNGCKILLVMRNAQGFDTLFVKSYSVKDFKGGKVPNY